MPVLASELRRQLENVVIQARDLAEAAARSALVRRAVDAAEPYSTLSPADRDLRTRLRARGRQAGDVRNKEDKTQSIEQLTQELAYEYWHRMLFARFLAENHVLMHPTGVPVSLADCEELAPDEGAVNGFALAARYASSMLPEIFRIDDVLLEIEFPVNDRQPLEKLLASLPVATFTADDSLGWVYQFWQTRKKEAVNKSGAKIDGRTISAVTQLFTEHYMVQFLLHNTIGAWWCGRRGVSGPPGGAGVPAGLAPVAMEFLRWRDDGTPAAGQFEGWPKALKDFTMLDPCCGSGHFLVAAFGLLVPLRMLDEGLSARDACAAVLRENLFGLELDPRCTQIAAFALAMAAWTYRGEDGQPLGYRPLPVLNIACSGQGVVGSKEDWTKIGNGDKNMVVAMGFLYDEFKRAPTLGSLINPRSIAESVFFTGLAPLQAMLERALKKSEVQADPDRAALGVAAQGIVAAASMMSKEFTLVATNVPYLARGKQAEELQDYLADVHPAAKSDLATAFVERSLEYCVKGGSTALVTPQNWLFLRSYKGLREWMLRQVTWDVVAKLGPAAFDDMNWWAANTLLSIHTIAEPADGHVFAGMDASAEKGAMRKGALLLKNGPSLISQIEQRKRVGSIISFDSDGTPRTLGSVSTSFRGHCNGDSPRFERSFWEIGKVGPDWEFLQGAPSGMGPFTGRESIVHWESRKGSLFRLAEVLRARLKNVHLRGEKAWNRHGIVIMQMNALPCAIYTGEIFDGNCATLVPEDVKNLPAIWSYCSSPSFRIEVRKLNSKVNVENGFFTKVPFDLEHWQQVAAEEYPDGLPEPHSDDPTQWLFKGHPNGSTDPLQVAVARLLGYRWPDQEPDDLDSFADSDGIVPIPAVRGEPPASERLREVLRAAFGSGWSGAVEDKLLVEAGAKAGTSLDLWLRNTFFEKHCARFHNRPFVWHVWDGHKEGFSCLVNYHKLDHKGLQTLTYAYLGDWITTQAADARGGKLGADLRLKAAQDLQDKLKRILAGEPDYDIFVRWKPLAEQPIGWNPDLNDGVRLNIRPFLTAGVLRWVPKSIKWTKDRGNEPERDKDQFPWFWKFDPKEGKLMPIGERVNDVHLTNAQKQAAREKSKGPGG
jgi:hypothetical protein